MHHWELVSLTVPMPSESASFQGSWNLVLLRKENWSFSTWNAPSLMKGVFQISVSTQYQYLDVQKFTLTLTLRASSFERSCLPSTAQCPHSAAQCHHAAFQPAFLHFYLGQICQDTAPIKPQHAWKYLCPFFPRHKAAEVCRLEPKRSWCYNKALRKAAGCIVTSLWAKSLP